MRFSLVAVVVLVTSVPVLAAERHHSREGVAQGRKSAGAGKSEATPIAAKDLAKLKEAIRAKTMPDDQLSVLRKAAAKEWFTTVQAYQVVELFEYDDDREDAIKILTKRLTDPANAPELNSLVKKK